MCRHVRSNGASEPCIVKPRDRQSRRKKRDPLARPPPVSACANALAHGNARPVRRWREIMNGLTLEWRELKHYSSGCSNPRERVPANPVPPRWLAFDPVSGGTQFHCINSHPSTAHAFKTLSLLLDRAAPWCGVVSVLTDRTNAFFYPVPDSFQTC